MSDSSRLERAFAAFDRANAEDPNEVSHEGGVIAKELLYALRMSETLTRLEPEASEELQLAVRAQHIGRWKIPRADYPEGRAGYKRWRSELGRMHAELAGELMTEVGYDDATVKRVGDLLQKKRLAHDPEVQALEDTACLVFLEHYFVDFAAKHPRDKVIAILQKTWRKMSERGRAAALELPLDEEALALVTEALEH